MLPISNVSELESELHPVAEHTELVMLGNNEIKKPRTSDGVQGWAAHQSVGIAASQPTGRCNMWSNCGLTQAQLIIEKVADESAGHLNVKQNPVHTFWVLGTPVHHLTAHTLCIHLNHLVNYASSSWRA